MVFQQRREQVVRERDGLEIAGEVQIDVFHRHHLGVPTTGRPALHAEDRAERRLAQADDGALPDAVERVTQAHGGRRLALTGGRGVDAGDQHEAAVRPAVQRAQVRQRDLGLVAAVGHQRLLRQAQALARDVGDGTKGGGLGDLDVAAHGNSWRDGAGRKGMSEPESHSAASERHAKTTRI